MDERQGFGSAVPAIDRRRGRFVTTRNAGTPYTPDQRHEALDVWWETHMQDSFPQLAQDLISARSAAIASRAGLNVVDVGAEMEALDALRTVRAALTKTNGLAINSVELTDKVVKEARALERTSGIPHLGISLSGIVVNAFADVRNLSDETRKALLQRTHQRRLPSF
jgi:hypothetical protein